MRMMTKSTDQMQLFQVNYRHLPRHTNEIRDQILADLRAISATQSGETSEESPFTITYNPKCQRGRKGARGRNLRFLTGIKCVF